MPRLSRLVLLPAAFSAAACLAVGPGIGQEEPTSKITDQHSSKIEPLDPRLKPGNVMDQEMVARLISNTKPSNSWHKVPAWLAGRWQSTGSVVLLNRNEKTGKEESKTCPVFEEAGMSYMQGQYVDKQGQVWERDQSFRQSSNPENSNIDLYEIIRMPPIITDNEFTFRTQMCRNSR